MNRDELLERRSALTTSLGASGWDEDRIDIIGSNGATGEHYSSEPACSCGSVVGEYHNPECSEVNAFQAGRINSADEALAWNGEGLPPVGANCLMQSHILGMWANEWLEVEVLAHKPPLMIGWCEEKQIAIWSDACRPIRTKEDEAVEHMKSVAGTSYVRPEYMEMITRALYRAGYRKTEATQ